MEVDVIPESPFRRDNLPFEIVMQSPITVKRMSVTPVSSPFVDAGVNEVASPALNSLTSAAPSPVASPLQLDSQLEENISPTSPPIDEPAEINEEPEDEDDDPSPVPHKYRLFASSCFSLSGKKEFPLLLPRLP